ncbi:MAG TPA: PDZ domain-containing protein [Clostridiaceae bacterium]|nr:PDZ domain-containing protein [Clostridiaceae bacterium]
MYMDDFFNNNQPGNYESDNNYYNNNNYYLSDDNGSNYNYSTSFYTESYKKPKNKKRPGILTQMIIVALISSILGGSVVFTAFQFVAPALKPVVNKYFGNILQDKAETGSIFENNENGDAEENGNSSKSSSSGVGGTTYVGNEISTSYESVITKIAEEVSPAIVGIRVTARTTSFFFGETEGTGEGSGIIIKSNGYVVTNYHVIQNALDRYGKILSNAKIEVFLKDNMDMPYKAEVVGTDSRTDLAVLKIDGSNFPVAELGDSDKVKVGELAIAIGNPGGLEYMGSVTAGIISGLNRTIVSESGDKYTLIQTDAAINPGNSGGALLNSKGQVIGVNSIKIVAEEFEGLGFAIPINIVKEIVNDLMEYNYVKGRPFLGISSDPSYDEAAAKYYNAPVGILVAQVIPFSGAYKAGIQRGDIITKFDGKAVKTVAELNELKNKHKPGDTVKVEIYRDGETLTLDVTLTEER